MEAYIPHRCRLCGHKARSGPGFLGIAVDTCCVGLGVLILEIDVPCYLP